MKAYWVFILKLKNVMNGTQDNVCDFWTGKCFFCYFRRRFYIEL